MKFCDSVPLQLPTMTFNNIEIKRRNFVKFLSAIIDESLIWKSQTEVIGNKIFKNIGVFYRTSHLLDFKNICICISYVNFAFATTLETKLYRVLKKQKHAGRCKQV